MYAMCAPMCTRVSLSSPNLRECAIFLPDRHSLPHLYETLGLTFFCLSKGKKTATQPQHRKFPPSHRKKSPFHRSQVNGFGHLQLSLRTTEMSHFTCNNFWGLPPKTPKTPGFIGGGKHPGLFWDHNGDPSDSEKAAKAGKSTFLNHTTHFFHSWFVYFLYLSRHGLFQTCSKSQETFEKHSTIRRYW